MLHPQGGQPQPSTSHQGPRTTLFHGAGEKSFSGCHCKSAPSQVPEGGDLPRVALLF